MTTRAQVVDIEEIGKQVVDASNEVHRELGPSFM